MNLQSLFYPRGVVVVGSTAQGKLGYELVRQLQAGGFERIYAVNPKAQGLDRTPGFAAVADIGKPVDLAVVVSPPKTVPDVLRDCSKAGVSAAVLITAGFSEVGDHQAEQEVIEVARELDIRFVGPNCAGLVNTRHHLTPTLETLPPTGGVSLIAQSGAVGGVVLAWAKEFGLGISKFVSYGNGADLREIELLRYLSQDPDTDVVALYIESVSDGPAFMQAVRECTRVKPLVVIKTGRSSSGQRAALSHTGSMAGADRVYDAALRQCGAIRVYTIEEMFDICKGFSMLPPLQGDRTIIVTNSGGPGVMAADWAEDQGLVVAEPSDAARATLREFLPPHCAFKNPIDLTVEGTETGYRDTLVTLLDEYDAALALNIAPPYLDSNPLARGVVQALRATGKPVAAAFLPAAVVSDAVAYLQENGVPNFATGERALTALKHMAAYQARNGDWRPLPAADDPCGLLPGESQMLEHEAMAWLAENGIPVPAFCFAATRDQAMAAAAELGFPVVFKVVSPQILHKSDLGGVKLNLRNTQEAGDAFDAIAQIAAGKDFRGVVIYGMIKAVQEVLLGISLDPQFGPVVAFGLGGIYTEVFRDISLRVAPIDRLDADAMIREIKSLPLLQGVRGQAPCDLDALADVLVTISQLPFRYPDIAEIDLNPVFMLEHGLVVGDVRVIRRSK